MRTFMHPATGAHVTASAKTAVRLLKEGWEELGETTFVEKKSSKTSEPKKEPTPGDNGGGGKIPAPEKPLDQMGMVDLGAYAEKIGMPDAAELKKPGSSKAKAKDAIEAFIAAAQQ